MAINTAQDNTKIETEMDENLNRNQAEIFMNGSDSRDNIQCEDPTHINTDSGIEADNVQAQSQYSPSIQNNLSIEQNRSKIELVKQAKINDKIAPFHTQQSLEFIVNIQNSRENMLDQGQLATVAELVTLKLVQTNDLQSFASMTCTCTSVSQLNRLVQKLHPEISTQLDIERQKFQANANKLSQFGRAYLILPWFVLLVGFLIFYQPVLGIIQSLLDRDRFIFALATIIMNFVDVLSCYFLGTSLIELKGIKCRSKMVENFLLAMAVRLPDMRSHYNGHLQRFTFSFNIIGAYVFWSVQTLCALCAWPKVPLYVFWGLRTIIIFFCAVFTVIQVFFLPWEWRVLYFGNVKRDLIRRVSSCILSMLHIGLTMTSLIVSVVLGFGIYWNVINWLQMLIIQGIVVSVQLVVTFCTWYLIGLVARRRRAHDIDIDNNDNDTRQRQIQGFILFEGILG